MSMWSNLSTKKMVGIHSNPHKVMYVSVWPGKLNICRTARKVWTIMFSIHYTRWTQIWLVRLNTAHIPNRKGGQLSSFSRPSLTAHLLPRSWGISRTSLRSHGSVLDWRCKRGCGMMQGNAMVPRDGKLISNITLRYEMFGFLGKSVHIYEQVFTMWHLTLSSGHFLINRSCSPGSRDLWGFPHRPQNAILEMAPPKIGGGQAKPVQASWCRNEWSQKSK